LGGIPEPKNLESSWFSDWNPGKSGGGSSMGVSQNMELDSRGKEKMM